MSKCTFLLPPTVDVFSLACGKFSLWFGSSSPHFKGVPEGATPQHTDDCFLQNYRTSEMSSSLCSAPLTACPVPDCGLSQTVASLIYMGIWRTLPEPETWPHVLQSYKPLQYLVAKTDKLSFSSPTLQDVACMKEETVRGTGRLALMF